MNDVVSEYSDKFLKDTYRHVCLFEPHSTDYIVRMQEEFMKRDIEIPVIHCGYKGISGIEYHPNKRINERIKALNEQ